MASLMDDYRKQQLWGNLSRIGQGLLMASAGKMPLGQGLAYGLGQAQMPDFMEMQKLKESQKKAEREEAERKRWQSLFEPGRSPGLSAQQALAEGGGPTQAAASLMGGPAPSLMQQAGYSDPQIKMLQTLGPDASKSILAKGMFPPPKAPTTRTRKSGDKFITEEWDDAAKGWKQVSEAPRYKPGVEVNVAAQNMDPLLNFMTKTQRGKEAAGLREQRVKSVQMVKQGANLIQNLRQSGDQAVSWSGGMVRGVDTFLSQGRAIAKNFGIKMGDGSISKKLDPNDWQWGPLASESSVIKSKILGLAVAITKADQGSRPSDFDVQTSIERIAGNAGSASRMADVIQSLLREKMGDFSVRYNTLAPDYGLEKFDWKDELSNQNISLPGLTDDPLGIR